MRAMYTRRHFASALACAATVPWLVTPTAALAALDEETARAMVDKLVADINAVIYSGKSEQAMYKEFERIFRKYADLPYIAAYAMGRDARRASPAQKKAFTEAFTQYVSRKYGKRFREFIGGRLEVKEVRKIKNFYEVRTIAFLKGQEPFEVSFHVSDRAGTNKFFNMYIEGINMLLTERTEIGAMLDKRRGDIDAMIADLRKAG